MKEKRRYTHWVENKFMRDWNSDMDEVELCRIHHRKWRDLRDVACRIRKEGIYMKARKWSKAKHDTPKKTEPTAHLIKCFTEEDMTDMYKRHNRGVPINIIAQLHGITKYKVKAVLAHKAEELFVQSVNRK